MENKRNCSGQVCVLASRIYSRYSPQENLKNSVSKPSSQSDFNGLIKSERINRDQKCLNKETMMKQTEDSIIWIPHDVSEQIHIGSFYSFFERHYDNGYNFSGETHNFWECVYVLDGTICVSGDERVYNLSKDEIIFHKPLELHKFYVNGDAGATLLIFSFSLTGPLSDALKNMVFKLPEDQKCIIASLRNYIHRKQTGHTVPDELSYLNYLFPFEDTPVYPQMLTTYIYQLILSLICDGNVSEVSTAPDALTFGQAVNYMNSQICDQPTVTDIARYCNVSESSLKRIFYKYSGIGIHKYFLKLKVKTATELLESGSGVAEAAEKLGFSSQAYFSAVFKRETGVCPSDLKY